MNITIRIMMLLLIFLASCVATSAQASAWRIQFPCDRSFSIEVPAHLYEVTWFEGKHGPSIEPEEDRKNGARAFVALQGTPKKRQFGVVVQNVPREERAAFVRKEFGGLYFVIGGDDATATSQKIVRVNGLTGREYVYAKEIAEDTYTRGRIFYAAGRIYIIVFVGTSAEDLGSQEADRFLNSFRIRG
ncbi:MAG TPA: hypothetical protein VGD61_16215 [Pyrinomonadaceae bacterium]